MHEYDIALKSVLTRRTGGVLTRLTGREVVRWHNSELPEVRSRHADLLGETADQTLVHVELQSTNDPRMALRMLEYAVAIQRGFERFPEQLVLYVGEAPLRMQGRVGAAALAFECRIADIRELDGEEIAAERRSRRQYNGSVGAAVGWCVRGPADAIAELIILAGLRSLASTVEREIERMPILDDIMDHPVIGRERRFGMALGERVVILSMMGKRFGGVPDWARERVESMDAPELEKLALRLLDASTIEDLLP
jgi:hypothetical protein